METMRQDNDILSQQLCGGLERETEREKERKRERDKERESEKDRKREIEG